MFLRDLPYGLEKYTNSAPAVLLEGITIGTATLFDGTVGRVMSIPFGSGFGFVDLRSSSKFFMRVDHKIAYEVSFWFRQPVNTPSFTLSVNAFSAYNIPKPVYDSSTAFTANNFWIESTDRVLGIVDQWYFARYVLYNYDSAIISPHLTSLAAGKNLKMSEGTANVIINLDCIDQSIDIYNLKFKPLYTPFSTGFVQGCDLMEVWRKNNSGQYSESKLDSIAKNLLLPYNFANTTIKL